jgi:hypothetical protein
MVTSTRIRFNHELLRLQENVLHLGAMARLAVARVTQALTHFYLGKVPKTQGSC